MQIEFGTRLLPRDAICYAIEIREQLLERRIHFDNDLGTARRDQWGVAAKLDDVTHPLLAVKQDSFAVDGFAQPERLLKMTWPFAERGIFQRHSA